MTYVKTSVSMPGDLHARYIQSGVSLPELLRRGLAADAPDPHAELAEIVRAAVRAELESAGLVKPRGTTDAS